MKYKPPIHIKPLKVIFAKANEESVLTNVSYKNIKQTNLLSRTASSHFPLSRAYERTSPDWQSNLYKLMHIFARCVNQ